MDVENELLMDAMAAINARFSSGNSVPVDRAWVTYAEWKNLQFALSLALTPLEGHVVVTRNEAGQAVAVTRQDDEGRSLSVIAELGPSAGWAAAADRELVAAELGVAKIDDSMDAATAKLRELIDWHVSAATDPAVNGGYVLVPVAVQKDAERYRWLKQCSREQYLLARGMFGLAEDAIDAVIRDESKEIKDGH